MQVEIQTFCGWISLLISFNCLFQELHSARSKMAADMAEMQSVAQRQSSKVNDLESQTVQLSKSNTELEKHCQTLEEQLRELQQCHDQLVADHETLQVEHTELASASHSVPVSVSLTN